MNRRHAFIIVVLAFTAYFPTLRTGFIWDDHVIIEANPTLHHWSWSNLHHDFTSDNAGGRGDNYYRPMQAITDRIDYSLWGLNPFGYHLTNLLFHIGCGLLLYILVLQLGYSKLVAILLSALFVVHPIDTREFIEISGRCTPMGYFFMLATLCLAVRPGLVSAGAALVTYALALFSKENALLTPALLAMVFFFRRESWRRYRLLIPLLALSICYMGLRNHAVHQFAAGPLDPAMAWLFMLKVFFRVCFHYALLILWP